MECYGVVCEEAVRQSKQSLAEFEEQARKKLVEEQARKTLLERIAEAGEPGGDQGL